MTRARGGLDQSNDEMRDHANRHSRMASNVTGSGEGPEGTGYVGGTHLSGPKDKGRPADIETVADVHDVSHVRSLPVPELKKSGKNAELLNRKR